MAERLTPQEVAAQQAKLPPWLQLTRAQREEDEALQQQLATTGPLTHMTREERVLSRAAALQHHARTQLAVAEWHTSPEEVEQAKRTLAEGLAMAGDFREAADLHPDQEHALRFAQIADAVERDDDEKCDCVPVDVQVNGKTETVQPRIIAERVFSKKHNRVTPLVRCTVCGDENVRTPEPPVAERAALIAKARREAKR